MTETKYNLFKLILILHLQHRGTTFVECSDPNASEFKSLQNITVDLISIIYVIYNQSSLIVLNNNCQIVNGIIILTHEEAGVNEKHSIISILYTYVEPPCKMSSSWTLKFFSYIDHYVNGFMSLTNIDLNHISTVYTNAYTIDYRSIINAYTVYTNNTQFITNFRLTF